jgi:hypothetical protein
MLRGGTGRGTKRFDLMTTVLSLVGCPRAALQAAVDMLSPEIIRKPPVALSTAWE